MDTKKCTKCGEVKPHTEFHKHKQTKSGLKSRCKSCNRKEAREFYQRNPEPFKARARKYGKQYRADRIRKLHELRDRSHCIVCHETDSCVLDFHHLDGSQDENMPVSRAAGSSWSKMWKELAKCTVVCANCHRRIHAGKVDLEALGLKFSPFESYSE